MSVEIPKQTNKQTNMPAFTLINFESKLDTSRISWAPCNLVKLQRSVVNGCGFPIKQTNNVLPVQATTCRMCGLASGAPGRAHQLAASASSRPRPHPRLPGFRGPNPVRRAAAGRGRAALRPVPVSKWSDSLRPRPPPLSRSGLSLAVSLKWQWYLKSMKIWRQT